MGYYTCNKLKETCASIHNLHTMMLYMGLVAGDQEAKDAWRAQRPERRCVARYCHILLVEGFKCPVDPMDDTPSMWRLGELKEQAYAGRKRERGANASAYEDNIIKVASEISDHLPQPNRLVAGEQIWQMMTKRKFPEVGYR